LWGIPFFWNTLLFPVSYVILTLRIIGKKNQSKSLHFVKPSAMGFTTKNAPSKWNTKNGEKLATGKCAFQVH
jgi:hypothetical protein